MQNPTYQELFDRLMSDVRELAAVVSDDAVAKAAGVKTKAAETYDAAKGKVLDVAAVAKDKGAAVAEATDAYVKENPWRSIGAGVGIGVVLGIVVSKLSSR